MYRGSLLLALLALGCEPPAEPPAPRAQLEVPAPPVVWPLGKVTGTLGRGQAPQLVEPLPITGSGPPLALPMLWAVPGKGPVRAVASGLVRGARAVELVEVDTGRVVWRDAAACGTVVGVSEAAIVCADAKGTRALGMDGKLRWNNDATFLAMTDDRVITAGAGESVILDAETGNEIARVKLPAGVSTESIVASCGDAGRELFSVGADAHLERIAEGKGGPQLTWSLNLGNVVGLDACTGDTVLATVSTQSGTGLVAIARQTGIVTGRVDGLRGYWPARDGSDRIEISTPAGVASWPRDLATSVVPSGTPAASAAIPLTLPRAQELLAKRGDRRLVRITEATAALLDRKGVRAYVPLGELGAVLGDTAILAGSWRTSPGETLHRFAIPPPFTHTLRMHPPKAPVGVTAELRDLPVSEPLDVSHAITRAGTASQGVAALAIDPLDSQRLYVATLDTPAGAPGPSGLARLDLAAGKWAWHAADGCGGGTPVGVAVAREVVVCAARGPAAVTASTPEGKRVWQWTTDNVDGVSAAGDIVVAFDADRATVLDARHGDVLARFQSADGMHMRAVPLDIAGMTMLVTYDAGRVVAWMPRVDFVPAWSYAVAGVVRDLAPSGDGVLVTQEDGDAYRIDARTAKVTALPGLNLAWGAAGDVVFGAAVGGPVPPEVMPAPPPPPRRVVPVAPRRRRQLSDAEIEQPPFSTPWPAPGPLADSWQLTLYELGGGLRARNDYALALPVTPPGERGPGDSYLVVTSGPGNLDTLVIDPRRGDPIRRLRLPEESGPGLTFSTIVDGHPVAGTILPAPLRAVLF